MSELLTAAQMRAVERAAIESGAVTGLELMERASAGVVEAVFEEWPDLEAGAHRAVVLCGPGNNGGDGFVVARLLKGRKWDVEVFLYGDPAKLPPDAMANYERWCELGAVGTLTAETFEERPMPGLCDLVVDALFGTGLSRAVELPLTALSCVPELGQIHRTVAIDFPSGLCSASGRRIGGPVGQVTADLTVAFHRAKPGHAMADGPATCGRLVMKSIGLDRSVAHGSEGTPRPRAGEKPPPRGAVGGCPAKGRTGKL